MKVVWKYDLGPGTTTLALKHGAKLRHLAYQDSMYGTGIKAWFTVTPTEGLISDRTFTVIMTGQGIPRGAEYLGTVTDPDGLVLHVFEERK